MITKANSTKVKRVQAINKFSTEQATMNTPVISEEVRKRIEKKAYELYEQRGCVHGYNLKDWLEAEKIIFVLRAQNKG